MKKLIFLLFLTALTAKAQDQIVGTWLNEEKDGKIQIYKSNDRYFGKLISTPKLYETDGKTLKKDKNNPDASLKGRTLLNLNILTNLKYADKEWNDGHIYDPKNGKTYKCVMTLEGNKLNIRGYIGISMFGRTTVWTRI